jgi:endonuclease YncB( thermonuclease family)
VIRFFTTFVFCGFCLAELHASERWVTLENCVYIANPSNDGDSFHVKAADKEYIFRLYFVDAAEINAVNPPRLVEQAKYFGITVPQTIELGRAADSYVRDRLARPFTVTTRFAHSPTRGKVERFYAFVRTEDGDLGEQLIAHGLARIFGTPATPPDLVSSAVESKKLAHLENTAKEQQLGGWGTNAERQETTPAPSASPMSHKLDVNGATKKELEKLPGIGPVLALRIIAARPMKSADDLQRVDGIGKKKYEMIRPFFDW